MKTIYSLAVICVIALAQTSLDAMVVSPEERAEFKEWSVEKGFLRLLGADTSFELVECVRDTIDLHGILSTSEKQHINESVDSIKECIESGDKGYDFKFSIHTFNINADLLH